MGGSEGQPQPTPAEPNCHRRRRRTRGGPGTVPVRTCDGPGSDPGSQYRKPVERLSGDCSSIAKHTAPRAPGPQDRGALDIKVFCLSQMDAQGRRVRPRALSKASSLRGFCYLGGRHVAQRLVIESRVHGHASRESSTPTAGTSDKCYNCHPIHYTQARAGSEQL